MCRHDPKQFAYMSEKSSYSQILKSSSIIGGAAAVALLLGMVRTKFAAVLIGATGIGLLANYSVIQGLIGTITGFGLYSSGVRDVAVSFAKNDQDSVGRTILSLRRMCWITGLLGLISMVILSPFLSQWTFGSYEYVLHISSLGIVLLIGSLSGGQSALLQGIRRIGDIARANILGAASGTLLSIGFYFWLGLEGIVPAMVTMSLVQFVIIQHYARQVSVPQVEMRWLDSVREAGGMVRLGLAFMWSTLIASIVGYAANALITNQIGLAAVGIYTAGFTLSGMFVNFVLGAMGADYYPRLAGIAHDRKAMCKLVNEQTEIGLLLAVPGLLGTMSLAPWIIHALYTSSFLPAVSLIQWFILGCVQRVVSWPLGFVLRALGKKKLFVVTETVFHGSHLLLLIVGLFLAKLEGAAIAFFLMNSSVTVIIYIVIRRLISFRWSSANRRLFIVFLPTILITFIFARTMPILPVTIYGVAVTALATVFCLRELVVLVGDEHRLIQMIYVIPGIKYVCRSGRLSG